MSLLVNSLNVKDLMRFAKDHKNTNALNNFVSSQEPYLRHMAEENGVQNHVREGDDCLGKVGYILVSGIFHHNDTTRQILKDLYSKAVLAYHTVSAQMPHFSQRLLKKLDCVINDQPLTADLLGGNQTGLAQMQARANWASCKQLPQPNSEHLTDYELLSFYMDHESGYLKEVFSFGEASVNAMS